MKKILILLILILMVGCDDNGPSNQANDEMSNQVVVNSENENIHETSDGEEASAPEEIYPKIVEIAVDNLKVRETYSLDSEVLGMVHLDDRFDVIGEAFDEDGNLWYHISFEGQAGFIAAWYTLGLNPGTINRVYDEMDNFLGFFHDDDLRVISNTKILRVIREELYEYLEAKLDGESVKLMKRVPNKTNLINLPWDMTLEYDGVTLEIPHADYRSVFIEFVDDRLIVTKVLQNAVYENVMILDGKMIALGRDYEYLMEDHTWVFLNPDILNEVVVADDDMTVSYTLELEETIQRIVPRGMTLLLHTADGKIITLNKVEGIWAVDTSLYHAGDEDLILYQYHYNELVKAKVIPKTDDLETILTDRFYLEDNHLYRLHKLTVDNLEYYTLELMTESQVIEFTEKSMTLLVGEQRHEINDFSGMVVESYEDNDDVVLLKYYRESPEGLGYYFESQYYMVMVTTGLMYDHNNLISFSENGQYFISCQVPDEIAMMNIEVYSIQPYKKIHTIQALRKANFEFVLEDIWRNNVIRLNVTSKGVNAWLDIDYATIFREEYFNPATGEEDPVEKPSQDMVTLSTYDQAVKGKYLGEVSVKIGDLDFTNDISYEDGQIIFWFKDKAGNYTKRPKRREELFSGILFEPLFIYDAYGRRFDYQSAYSSIEMHPPEHGFLPLEIWPLEDEAYIDLLDLKEGRLLTFMGDYMFSPDGKWLVSHYLSEDHQNQFLKIYDLETFGVVYDYRRYENEDTEGFYFTDVEWQDDKSLILTDESAPSDMNASLYLIHHENEWGISTTYNQ